MHFEIVRAWVSCHHVGFICQWCNALYPLIELDVRSIYESVGRDVPTSLFVRVFRFVAQARKYRQKSEIEYIIV